MHPQPNGHPNPNPSKVDAENSLDLASSSIDELDETIQNLMLELESESEVTNVAFEALRARIIELLHEYEDEMAEEKALRAELRDLEELQSQMDLEDFQDETMNK
ncbi:uncharacterized protein LOC6524057 [Drosophila yakuba]|uniref:Uncharacterized protein n=1 Tax=Drosophila yakuba TaxID=7245 RepID=B4PZ67_DROYA|nr:uncharacterized protein LOC6524057 [Drosophila yakuba]EDX01034.2 uncharacterized protein Dyak_GE16454 [Drosophila yakuba]